MPTVEQVWRTMPRGTSLVAGESGIYNEVSWVVTLRPTSPGFDHLRGKELALVDEATANGLGISLTHLTTSLAEQGASALGFIGEIVPAIKDIANNHKIPIMEIPKGSNLSALEAEITILIREERDRLYQREQELNQILMELALAGRGVDTILLKLKELTGRVVMLLDLDFTPHAADLDPRLSSLSNTLASVFPSPPSSITGLKLAEGLSGFLSPINGKQGTEGYLLTVSPSTEVQEEDRIATKVGALSLAIELSRKQAAEDVEDKFQAEMVESLLNGELSTTALNERAGRLGLELSRYYVAIAVQVSGSGYKSPLVARKVAVLFNKALCHSRSDLLIILYPFAAQPTSLDLHRLGEEVSRRLSSGLGAKVTLGVGRAYIGTVGLQISFQEAERALMMGKKLFGEGSASSFGDLGVYRLLLTIGPDELKSFYRDAIGQLADYDQKHEGELLHTLEAILRYPTLSDTAKALHVHRNTLLYRLQRIQEITNLNLDDGETRLTLHLALRAGEVIRSG
jgi:purine catabolism regulator